MLPACKRLCSSGRGECICNLAFLRRHYLLAVMVLICTPTGLADYRVKFDITTTKGEQSFVILVHEDWAPLGAERFKQLVESKFYDDSRVFRAEKKETYQFGLPGDPKAHKGWEKKWKKMKDDKRKVNNGRGTVAFAMSGKNSRTTQVAVNVATDKGGTTDLDKQGLSPFGEIEEGGLPVVESIFLCGDRPDQTTIKKKGNKYLDKKWPKMSKILRAEVLEDNKSSSETAGEL